MNVCNSSTQRWSIVVVHGVGDTDPGHTIDAVAGPMMQVNPCLSFDNCKLVFDVGEQTQDGKKADFPVFLRRGRAGNENVSLFECYWADLTRVGTGTPQFLVELFRVVYGIRHLAIQATSVPGKASCFLNLLYRLVLFLLQGPIFALMIFMSSQSIAYLTFFESERYRPIGRVPGALALMLHCAVLGGVAGWLWSSARANPLRRPLTWQWLAAISVALGLVGLLRCAGYLDYIYDQSLFEATVNPEQIVVGDWMLIVAAIDSIVAWLQAIVAGLMIIALVTLGVSYRSGDVALMRSRSVSFLAALSLLALWELGIEPLNLIIQIAEDKALQTERPLYTVWFTDICLIAMALLLLLAVLYLITRRIRWAANVPADDPVPGEPLRLIVGAPIRYAIMVSMLPYILLHPVDAVLKLRVYFAPYPFIFSMALLILVTGICLSRVLRNVIHIISDIITHFESPDANALFPRAGSRYLSRRRITRRFTAVLNLALSESPTRLLVIAHSQGTMIALDGLSRRRWHERLAKLEQVVLITFGSPFSHIYQHYFPVHYPSLNSRRWASLHANLRIWVNLFRPDDYVGTIIKKCNCSYACNCAGPCNIPLPPGTGMLGHTRYWEESVFRRIESLLPGYLPSEGDRTMHGDAVGSQAT
ncbi:MAG: hypothetical protein ACLQU5_07015 [Isosphaeraceae bacterium]